MTVKRMMLNVLVIAGLWYTNTALVKANMDPDSCYNICWPWVPCDTACIVGTETWTTCGETPWGCDPGE